MSGSLGLALYLIAAARAAEGAGVELPPPPRGEPCVWLHAPEGGATLRAILALAGRLRDERPGLGLVLTHPAGALPREASLPRGCLALPALPDDPTLMRRAFARWAPAVVVIGDGPLPVALIHAAEQEDRHAFLVGAGPPRMDPRWGALPGLQRALLRRLRRILARDAAAERALRRAGARPWRVEDGGLMAETSTPLPCNPAEREALAQRLGGRPLWLAVAVPEAEEGAVLAAHRAAQRLVHRLLLVLVPADPARGAALAAAAAGLGLRAARRSAEEEPDDDDHVYIADTEGELGLWYRLAPVTFMGGTFGGSPGGGSPDGGASGHATALSGRDPMEAAALGSAVVHGPARGAHADSYARLMRAGATWQVPGRDGATWGGDSAGQGGVGQGGAGARPPGRSAAVLPVGAAGADADAVGPDTSGAATGGAPGRPTGFWRGLLRWAAAETATAGSHAGAEALAEAVVTLQAPDRVALMARAGWAVATEGAQGTDRALALVLGALDGADMA